MRIIALKTLRGFRESHPDARQLLQAWYEDAKHGTGGRYVLYSKLMIRSFKDKETELLYETGKSKKFPISICKTGIRKLDYLNGAVNMEDLRLPPGNKLEALKREYTGKHDIRINDQYRLVFKFIDGDAHEVEITDYH